MKNGWKTSIVKLKDLKLWDENVRFDQDFSVKTGAGDNDIVNFFFDGKYKMLELVRLFMEQNQIPQDEKILAIKDGDKYKVLDGNRRVSAMTAIYNPEIIKNKATSNKIKNLKEIYNHKEQYNEIEILIAPNENEAKKIIRRRHYNIGFLKHGSLEKDRNLLRDGGLSDKESFALQYFEKMLQLVNEENREKLKAGYSTIQRMFQLSSNEYVKENLHVFYKDEQIKQVKGKSNPYKETIKKLIQEIILKKLNTRTINKESELKKYFNSLKKVDISTKTRSTILKKTVRTQEALKREPKYGMKYFIQKNHYEKIGELYRQISKIDKKKEIVINICIGHLLECSIKVLLREASNLQLKKKEEYKNLDRKYLNELLQEIISFIRDLPEEKKHVFANTQSNIHALKRMTFHKNWNSLRHNPRKTSTSFDTEEIKILAFEIIREIDLFLYENST